MYTQTHDWKNEPFSDELKKVILDQYQVLCDWVDILVAKKPELKTSAQSLYEIYTNKEIYHDIPELFSVKIKDIK